MNPVLKPPPIGVLPEKLWRERHPYPSLAECQERLAAVVAAIARYDAAGIRPLSYYRWWCESILLERMVAARQVKPTPRKRIREWLRDWFRRTAARLHLHKGLVCAMSQGDRDYHDYHDTADKYPDHFIPLVCERCGKEFWL